tara:strand:- start:1332 stop:1850 length:519 start_codon:yes stop_codon:yes gene_type:complete
MLTTPWTKFDAFKLGLIDKKGSRIKDKKVESKEEKSALTLLHRLVFNLKRIVNKVPFGKTAFASYAVALLLLKEETKLDEDQMDELCEKFYRHIKSEGILDSEMITETIQVPSLQIGHIYRLKRQLKEQNDTIYLPKSEVSIVQEHSMIFGLKVYVGFIDNDRVLVTGDDLY